MQILASFESPKFRSEGRRRPNPRSLTGARPHETADAAQHEHAMIPAENPSNARPRGRY
jgi:hypothetical protein